MKHLSLEQYERAVSYILERARPLDRQLWRYETGQADEDSVIQCLSEYRNEDGGFGHALEPDHRMTSSSVLATLEALSVLKEIRVSVGPLIEGALGWLADEEGAWDSSRRIWPYLPADSDAAPHAPWWNADGIEDTFGGFLINPRARILSHLFRLRTALPGNLDGALESLLLEVLECADQLERRASPDTMRSLLQLEDAPGLSLHARERLRQIIVRLIPESVVTDPSGWGEYGLQPLEVAPTPDSRWISHLGGSIENHLDHLVKNQDQDGSWKPFWSWGEGDIHAWSRAREEWAGVLTVRNLKALGAFGRLPLSA